MSERKIIIRNESSNSDSNACLLVCRVIDQGKISTQGGEPCYCFGTRFPPVELGNPGVLVFAQPNKASDTFCVRDDYEEISDYGE